ncbi:MAG: DUF1736 domain-containing protein [Flavobacteriales bacterium]|nr:DUF1736 domain-containing protein [Flavobacteriales bacterium]
MAKKTQNLSQNITAKEISTRTMVIISFLISFLFYGNSISNGFSLDDELVTTTDRGHHENVEKGIKGIKAIFSSNYAKDGKQNYEYRPIVTLSFAIEWSLFGDNPNRVHIAHFINIVLYAFCGILLFQLLNVLFQGKSSYFSALIVVLFLIHPIHSEVVNNLKNRDELLCLLFALISALFSFKWFDTKKIQFIVLAILTFAISMLSKKSSLPFLLMIPMMFYFFRNVSVKQVLSVFGFLALSRVIFALIKKSLLEDEQLRMFSYVENPLFDMGFYARIPMYFYSNLVYIEKLILPYPLSFYYGYNAIPLVGYTDWRFFVSVGIMLVALYFIFIGLKKKSIISFSILFFLMSIGGAANLLSPMVGIIGERFAFIGSIGFCMLVVYLLFHFLKLDIHETKIPSKIYFSLAVVILPSFIFTINRNKDWMSKKSLYVADCNQLVNSAKANSLLGSELQEEAYKIQKESIYKNDEMMDKVDSAILFYDRSLKIFPYYESNLNNRGALYFTFYYDYLESNRSFRVSTERNKTYYEGTLNIGNSYAKLAEGYSNLMFNLPLSNKGKTIQIKKIDSFYRKEKIYRTLAIIRQFEVNASQQLKNGVNTSAVQMLILNATNLEKLDPLLAKLQFSAKITQFLNLALQQNKIPNTQPLNVFRKSCIELMENELNLNDDELKASCEKLKLLYLDSAKIYFDKTYKLKPKMEQYYSSVSQFAMLLADYKLLIKVQNQYLKNFKNKYNTPQFVQLANAYYSLGDMQNAKLYFKKGMKDLMDEKNALSAKTIQTQADKNRILGLENEVIRLKAFVQNLKAARKAN